MPYKDNAKEVEAKKQWHQKHKERINAKHRAYRKENKPKVVAWLAEYKKSLHCARCGERHPACLHFHHREASTKRFMISAAVRLCVCIEEILREIEMCDVLCANCHAKEHYPI